MDEVKWYENNSLESIKNIIRDNISTASRSFNAIGYYLKNVRDRNLHFEAGYSSILEFAHKEFNISESWANRWMNINDRFSVDGNSPMLQEKYKNFDKSILAEMLTLSDAQLEQVTLTTTRAEIRDIKRESKEQKKPLAPAQVEPEKPLPLSAVGKLKKVYPEGSMLSTPGCEGSYSCFSCGRDCQIRQEGRYCVDAPLGNPFTCNTMNVHENLKADIGDKCMFVNLDLARIRTGDKEPVPCCKECTEKCGYECNRSAHEVKPSDQDIIDFTRGIDSLAKEYEAKGSCPQGAAGCMRNGEEGEAGKKICLKCWKEWLAREKILVEAKVRKLQEQQESEQEDIPTFEKGGEAYGATRSTIIESIVTEMIKTGTAIEDIDGDYCPVFGIDYWAYNIKNDGYITIENDKGEPRFLTSVERFQGEYEWHKTRLANLSPEDSEDDKEPETVNDSIDSANDTGEYPERACANCKYNDMTPDEFKVIDPDGGLPCNNCDDKLCNWIPKTEGVAKVEDGDSGLTETVQADVIQTEGIVLDCYNEDEGWHKEIILSSVEDEVEDEPEDEELGNMAELLIAKELLRKKQSDLKAWTEATKDNRNSSDIRNINKLKIEIGAMAAYICDLDNIVDPIPKPVQPELPILKNNDQRKDWAENYKTWGEWYYDENIDCHYYKYDFQNGDRLIVEEYRDREAYWGNDKRNYNYFHLLQKEKLKYEKNKTYEKKYEHDTSSMTEIVDYLKDFQKKGL